MSKTFAPHQYVPSQYLRLLYSRYIQQLVSMGNFGHVQLTAVIRATYDSNPTLTKTFKLPVPKQMATDMLSDEVTNNIYVEAYKWAVSRNDVINKRHITDTDAEQLMDHLIKLNIDIDITKEESPFNVIVRVATLKSLLIIVSIAQR